MAAETVNTRYEIIETLPSAETAPFVVSKARDADEGRVVTLSVLPAASLDGNAGRREFILAAAREAARLDHPHIARVFDQGVTDGGDVYIASEYLRGITLKERVRRVAPFSLAVAADIAVAMAEALASAHRAGVIHGDLRSQSVLLSPEGQIKVGEFAYRRAADAARPAPTVEGDIAALGAALYEMLTGTTVPEFGETPPSPRALNPGIPPAVDGIIQKALYPDPAVRYRTASALLADLQAARDALRAGRSLTWSPLAEKRAVRPALTEATTVAPRPVIPADDALNEEEFIDKKTRIREVERDPSRALSFTVGALGFLVVLAVIGFVYYLTHVFLAVPADVTVPPLVGKTFDDAQRLGKQQGFTVEEVGSDYSPQWPENQIYRQDPPPGRTIKAGKEVQVYRSLGPRLLMVPDLVGMTEERAQRALQDASLPAGTATEQYSETVQKGIVISQSSPAKAMVARGTGISFILSKGNQPPDAPLDVTANPTAPDKVDIHWSAAKRAESYTVTRSLDGNITTVAKGITDTHVTDTGLTPDTSYTYTVNAINAAGDSGPSDVALAITPAKVATTPVMGDPSLASPDTSSAGTDTLPPDTTTPATPPTARLRQFSVKFRVPRHPRGQRHVQFEVQDTTGTSLVYDEQQDAGEQIDAPVSGFGNKITIRIFLDGKLIKQQTL